MRTFFIVLALILLLGFLLWVFMHAKKTNKILKQIFKENSVIVFGRKGRGKDLLFQKVIYLRRKKHYISNIDYGYDGEIQPIDVLSCSPNTYVDFINGEITKVDRVERFEDCDYFLSDGGVYLPSQYDSALHRKYPSFSVYYALSRHLYNQNIHVNVQSLDRLWKTAREQADYYIKCRGKIKIFGLICCFITTYEKYSSAQQELNPMPNRLMNKYSKAEVDQFNATNGKIEKRFYFIKTKHIKYNTRHFKDVLFK